MAAEPLKRAISAESSMQGEVIVIKDVLSVGPIARHEGEKFSELRSRFWQHTMPYERNIVVNDLECLLETGNALSQNHSASIWIWMAPLPADICTYFWVLQYLARHSERLFVLNLSGLPFLDNNGALFFPKSISELSSRELVKARKLARLLTPAELEADKEEWPHLVKENAWIRVLEGGKKIESKPANHYDAFLLSFCTAQYQKASRVVGQSISRYNIPTGDVFLGWRLREMHTAGKLLVLGDPAGRLKDFEVRLPGEEQQLELPL